MRLLVPVLIACFALGCRSRSGEENYDYTFFKRDISQSQLLQDEEEIRRTAGVVRVYSFQSQGNGELKVEVDDKHHLLVQQKLSDMGYSKGQH